MDSIRKAIIPAAGLGKRMQPLSSYLPKPMLPLGKKPVLQYVVDELMAAGIREICIVTRSEYDSIISYFEDFEEITFVIDDSAGGPGRAILEAEDFINGEDFIIAFADAPLEGKNRFKVLHKLINKQDRSAADALLSIYPIPKEEISSRGIVKLEEELKSGRTVKIRDLIEKPKDAGADKKHPWASACRYVVTEEIFTSLKNVEPDEGGEIQLTAGIKHLIEGSRRVLGMPLPEGVQRHDTGNFEGYFRALKRFIKVAP